jgi:hypothetical protein
MKVFILWKLMLPNPHAPQSEGPICSNDAAVLMVTHAYCRSERTEFKGVYASLLACATKIQKLQTVDETVTKHMAASHVDAG